MSIESLIETNFTVSHYHEKKDNNLYIDLLSSAWGFLKKEPKCGLGNKSYLCINIFHN